MKFILTRTINRHRQYWQGQEWTAARSEAGRFTQDRAKEMKARLMKLGSTRIEVRRCHA